MKLKTILFISLWLTGISLIYSQSLNIDVHEIPFSDPKFCSCTFPEFYFFCRTYLAEGKSVFEPFSVNQNGSVRKAPELNVPNLREFRAAEHAKGEILGVADPLDRPGIYPDKNWKVRLIWDSNEQGSTVPMILECRVNNLESVKRLEIPEGELSFFPRSLFFDSKRNLFFFEYVDGPTGGRDIWLWVFDLKNEHLIKMGETSGDGFFIDPSQKWLVWVDGKQNLDVIGGKHVMSGHVVCYNLETGKKYRFTDGISIGFFYDWKNK